MDLHVISIKVILEIVVDKVNQAVRREESLGQGPDEGEYLINRKKRASKGNRNARKKMSVVKKQGY